MKDVYCKCESCNSLFDISQLDTLCPICESELSHRETNNIKAYFKVPKINNPNDFLHPMSVISNSHTKYDRQYLTRPNNKKYHILRIIPSYRCINPMERAYVLIGLSIVWNNDFENAFSITQDIKDPLKYTLTSTSLSSKLKLEDATDNKTYYKMYNKLVTEVTYEKFFRDIDFFKTSYNISELFSLYNSINWDLLDDSRDKKTYYEYAAVNYLLHIFELIKVPNIDLTDYDVSLLSFESIIHYLNLDYNTDGDIYYSPIEFHHKYIDSSINPLMETFDFKDYEDIYDKYSIYREGAVAPNAVGLGLAANRSVAVFNKLQELGYNPSMHLYSVGETTSLIPTFNKDGKIYFIECNENELNGINEFESVEDMSELINEIYNEDNSDHLFITIEGLTSDVLTFITSNSRNNKDFLTSLIDLNNRSKENYVYNKINTVQYEHDFNNGPLGRFTLKEITPQTLFKYGKTFYKLRNCRSLPGTQHGYMFIDNNDNVAGYIIYEDKVIMTPIGSKTVKTIITVEASSKYKSNGIEMAMIDFVKNKDDVHRIESRNLQLADRIVATAMWNKINNPINPSIPLFESISDEKDKPISLTEALSPSKRKQIEDKVYKVFDLLDKTGSNTQKYRELFKSMNNEKFDKYIKDLLRDDNKNFYLEVLPNKNCPRIKDCKDALDYLGVPTEEYVYYKHDGHEEDPIRTRYKVPVLYINLRRLQQMLSKKNTYSLDISKRNMKTG